MDELQNENKETIEGANGAENVYAQTRVQEVENIDAEKPAWFQEESKVLFDEWYDIFYIHKEHKAISFPYKESKE